MSALVYALGGDTVLSVFALYMLWGENVNALIAGGSAAVKVASVFQKRAKQGSRVSRENRTDVI